jgi:hypothetical protein
MKITRILSLLLVLASPALQAAQPFTITLPKDFSGPETASQGPMQNFVYSRPSTEPDVKALFQVTVVTMPADRKGDSLEKCLSSMLGGVEPRRTGFKKAAYVKGTLGSAESLSVDWEGVGEGHAMKGRMICAMSEGRLYCLHFQDSAAAWDKSLPSVEKALKTFAFAK